MSKMRVINSSSLQTSPCGDLVILAERELAAFMTAIKNLYGAEQASLSAELWLDELDAGDELPGRTSSDWRLVTLKAIARVANQLSRVSSAVV